jgi:hypothetical protein
MEINWIIICILTVCVIALTFFLIKRNVEDKRDYSEFLKKSEHA